MNAIDRIATLAAACGFLLVLGCQDSDAKRRAEVHQLIAAEIAEFQRASAVLSDPQQAAGAQQRISKLIERLKDTRGGVPGQRAAADQLACSAHQQLAAMAVAEARELQATLRVRRNVLLGMIDTAEELNAMVAALEAIDTESAHATLDGARNDTEQSMRRYGERMAELDVPIAQLTSENRADQLEAHRLRAEASELRRNAEDLGPATGFTFFEQAQDLDRQADGVDHELAHRELDLRYNYEPVRNLMMTNIDRARDRVDSIDEARQALEQFDDTMAGEAATTRTRLAEISESIEAGLAEFQESTARLHEINDKAADHLQRAAARGKAAAGAAGRDFAAAPRLATVRAYLQLGSIHTSRARGLQDQIALFRRLSGISNSVNVRLDELHQAHQAQVVEAGRAYENAVGELDRVTGSSDREEIEALKARITQLQATTTEATVEQPKASPAPALPAATRAPQPVAASRAGAASPQELLEVLRNAEDLASLAVTNMDLTFVRIESSEAKRLYEAITESTRATLELDQAIQDAFGTGLMETAGDVIGSSGVMPGLQGAELELVDVTEDAAAIVATSTDGQAEKIPLIRLDGRWFLDGTQQFNLVAEQMGTGPASVEYVQTLGNAISDLANRVQAGEFPLLQDALMALGEALQPDPGS